MFMGFHAVKTTTHPHSCVYLHPVPFTCAGGKSLLCLFLPQRAFTALPSQPYRGIGEADLFLA